MFCEEKGGQPAPDKEMPEDSVVTLVCSDGERFMQRGRLLDLARQAPILKVSQHSAFLPPAVHSLLRISAARGAQPVQSTRTRTAKSGLCTRPGAMYAQARTHARPCPHTNPFVDRVSLAFVDRVSLAMCFLAIVSQYLLWGRPGMSCGGEDDLESDLKDGALDTFAHLSISKRALLDFEMCIFQPQQLPPDPSAKRELWEVYRAIAPSSTFHVVQSLCIQNANFIHHLHHHKRIDMGY
tara:strand:+ start:552 stop:1268 length:717 start_codon:yes stop_codon:yes gene_type:complete